jgi:hypothetical protein
MLSEVVEGRIYEEEDKKGERTSALFKYGAV